jgi:hypothetical protein
VLLDVSRRIRFSVKMANQRATRFSQDALVGDRFRDLGTGNPSPTTNRRLADEVDDHYQ